MDEIKLSDLNIHDIGSSIQIAGTIWSGKGIQFVTLFPGKDEDFSQLKTLPMNLQEWEQFLHQTDILETEILARDPDSSQIVKAVVRKTQRSIDAYMQWEVFRRDNYSCRYCQRTGIPLTVDHIDLWENGGATIPENLLSACRSCNKDRGRMEYADWLKSPVYFKKSLGLTVAQQKANSDILQNLDHLKTLRVLHIRSR